jgi:magnesium transporter
VLRVLSFAISHFNEHLRIINRINDDLELRLNTSMENKYLLSMFSLNKGLIYYVSALNSNDTLLKKLQMGRSLNWTEAERELLEDIQIENGQSLQQANIYANILTSMMDARASVINNNVNQLMKNLTIVTISISLPTFFASLFGMNVKLPFGMNGDALTGSGIAFWGIIAVCILSVIVFLAFWMRRK